MVAPIRVPDALSVEIDGPSDPDTTTDDVWASDSSEDHYSRTPGHHHPHHNSDNPPTTTTTSTSTTAVVGEIPKLRREHHTAGYLAGITASKDSHLQPGFDSGYPLGAEIGLQVGQILGTLQGLGLVDLERVAKGELSPELLFSNKYYREKEVDELARPKYSEADGHPEVVRWKAKVATLLESQT